MPKSQIGSVPQDTPEHRALELLTHFYSEWVMPFRSSGRLDGSDLVDWFSERFKTIEDVVHGTAEFPLSLRLVMVAQAEDSPTDLDNCSILTRSGRFQKGLKMDSPNVGLFSTEEAAIAAARKARNRDDESDLLLIHLDLTIRPYSLSPDDQFRVDTQINLRTLGGGRPISHVTRIAAQ